MSDEQLRHGEVVAFLAGRPGEPRDLEALSGGAWSSAWAYRAGGEDLVVRFGRERSWYEADRMAMAFDGPDLPVPEVREVGTTPSGRAYAISVRHPGLFLEDTPVEQADAIGPTLTRLLLALYRVPAPPDTPVIWHQAARPASSWREFLRSGLDDPTKLEHGWSAALAADRELAALSAAVSERVRSLVDACPERRDLVHGDLLHGNVLISPDAQRVEAVLSWKCSVRGDFLFDAAWCTFWAPVYYPGIAAIDPLSGLLQDPAIRADRSALVDAAVRHHCYELHIGFTRLGWDLWTDDQEILTARARRLADVFERGPLPLTGI
jgi:aminoglycoside phosphotransferase (APT) family kinase protein